MELRYPSIDLRPAAEPWLAEKRKIK